MDSAEVLELQEEAGKALSAYTRALGYGDEMRFHLARAVYLQGGPFATSARNDAWRRLCISPRTCRHRPKREIGNPALDEMIYRCRQ